MNSISKMKYIEGLYEKTYLCKRAIDKDPVCFNQCKSVAERNYKKYLEEKLKNPVAAKIAMRDVVREHPLKYPEGIGKNLFELEKSPSIDVLVKKIEQMELANHETSFLRAEIISRNRIIQSSVTPKLRGFDKFLFKLKMWF